MIHPTALVAAGACLANDVEIGPYSIIGEHVTIGAGTTVGAHAVITGHTTIGAHNQIFHFVSLGEAPQDKKYAGEPTRLEIGDHNVIREFCTFNIGSPGGGGVTRVFGQARQAAGASDYWGAGAPLLRRKPRRH